MSKNYVVLVFDYETRATYYSGWQVFEKNKTMMGSTRIFNEVVNGESARAAVMASRDDWGKVFMHHAWFEDGISLDQSTAAISEAFSMINADEPEGIHD